MKMSKYFSDARENANNSFDSFSGQEFLNANGVAAGSSAGLGGATSQPYILSIANSTTDAVANVAVFNAYKSLAATATNFDNPAAITISMGIGGLTYGEMLYQSMNKPFVVGLTYLQSANASQVLETIRISQKDINGNESHKSIVPTIDPYQQQTGTVAIAFNYKIDGFTKLTIASILASATLNVYLYPAENVATGRALTGGAVVKGFQNPDLVKKDKVEIVGGGNQLGFGGNQASSRRSRRRF
mgnify:FL=1|tara:strand:- start:1908 stop:2639 length:732 start_codon:yes stop_codon:yes gene_type:complete